MIPIFLCPILLKYDVSFIFYELISGDSRTILVENGRVRFATSDHKPTLPLEQKRIEVRVLDSTPTRLDI